MSKNKPPKVPYRENDPMQDYYGDCHGNMYSVAKLVDDCKDLVPFDCPLAAINLTGEIWRGENMYGLAFHVKKVMDADLSKPIILDWHGEIADGRHRVIKALVHGRRTIKAVRMTWRPEPCREAQD